MKKLLMTAGLSLLVVSCGSHPKNESFLTENKAVAGKETKASGQKTEPNPIPENKYEPVIAATAATETKQVELDQAIASGDEEKIKRASQDTELCGRRWPLGAA